MKKDSTQSPAFDLSNWHSKWIFLWWRIFHSIWLRFAAHCVATYTVRSRTRVCVCVVAVKWSFDFIIINTITLFVAHPSRYIYIIWWILNSTVRREKKLSGKSRAHVLMCSIATQTMRTRTLCQISTLHTAHSLIALVCIVQQHKNRQTST